MSAPPYRAGVRRLEQQRIREREAAGVCMACGKTKAVPGSKLCAEHLSGLEEHRATLYANARDLAADFAAPPSSRRRGAP